MSGKRLRSRNIPHGVVEDITGLPAAKLGKCKQDCDERRGGAAEVRYTARFRARLLGSVTCCSYLGSQ